MLGAVRPLTLDEMNVALSVTGDSRCLDDLDLESSVSFRTTVRDLCGLFVNIRDSKIHLLHQTAKEFLLHQTAKEFLLKRVDQSGQCNPLIRWQQSMDAAVSNMTIAKICFSLLAFSDFEEHGPLDSYSRQSFRDAVKEYLEKYPFLEYASNNWQEHVRLFIDSECRDNEAKIISICNPNSKGCQTWFQIHCYATNKYSLRRLPQGFNEYIIAAYFGLSIMFNSLDRMGIRPDVTDYHSRGALSWALKNGHEDTACRLIMHNLVRPNLDALTALHFACTFRRVSVVECLLHNFKINGYDKASDGWTAVHYAAAYGGSTLLHIILSHDTDKAPSDIKEIALSHAARFRKFETVQFLIKQGVNLETRLADGDTVLYRSVTAEHVNMAELLLLAGAKADNLSSSLRKKYSHSCGETALYKAVSICNIGLVSLLLDHAADIDAKNRSSETALYRAVGSGSSGYFVRNEEAQAAIVQMLLEHGASVDCQTTTGDTPIRRALRAGSDPAKSIMEDFAKKSGLDITPIANSPQEMFTMKNICQRHFEMIEESDLVNTEKLRDKILKAVDKGHGPSLDVPRQRMFGAIEMCDILIHEIRVSM